MRAWWVVVACATACGRFGFEAHDAYVGAWDPTWPFRRSLVIDHAKVAADLTDFPVLVEVAGLAAQRIAITDASGQELAFELDAAPTLVAWVKLPALSSTTDTTLYLYYGNPNAPDHAQPAAVWSNGFVGVYHFGDGVSLDLADARGVNTAIDAGATAMPGWIAGAAAFDGSSNIAAPTPQLDVTAGALTTVTFWLYYAPTFNRMPASFYSGPTGSSNVWFEFDGCEGFNTGAGDLLASTAGGLTGRWVHVAAVFYNGIPDVQHNALYFDGAAQSLSRGCQPTSPQASSVAPTLYWGGVVGSTNYRLVGALDEGRVATGARSAAWVQTEFANQAEPAAFVQVGPEQAW